MKFKVIGILFLSSCVIRSDFEKNLITQGKKDYWNEFKRGHNNAIEYTHTQWCFYENGTSISLVSFDPDKKGTPSVINMESSNKLKWEYKESDKTLKICANCIYVVKRYNRDTILLNFENNAEYIFVRHQ